MAHILIIGAGHNGLVCAFYLALAGHKVSIVEQAPTVGGACRNEKWPSGAVFSPGANHYGMFHSRIAADMKLKNRGLSIIRADPQLIVGLRAGESLCIFDDIDRTRSDIARYNIKDSEGLAVFWKDVSLVRDVLQRHLFTSTPSLSAFDEDLENSRDGLSQLFVRNSIKQTLDHYFHSDEAKALFGATGFLYNAEPDEPGTSFALSYLSLCNTNGLPGWGVPLGGMGRLIELIMGCLNELNVQVFVNERVEQILVERNEAVGIRCDSGAVRKGDFIVSNADPYTTYVQLSGLSPSKLEDWKDAKFTGPCAKFNFTYRGRPVPSFVTAEHSELLSRSAYIHLPSIAYAEAAFRSARAKGYSDNVYFEFLSPSQFDAGLCAGELNVGSAYVLFANYDVIRQWTNDARQERKREVFLSVLAGVGLSDVEEQELLDPIDIQRKFGMYKGNVDHGAPILSNIFEGRNVDQRSGIARLVICGSGSHPGGLVTGVPGFNAAQRVVAKLG